jgi:hypothetical protein
VPHIVIDNFLGAGKNNKILSAIEEKHSSMELGTVNNFGTEVQHYIKRNRNFWVDPFDLDIAGVFRNQMSKLDIDTPELDHMIGIQSRTHVVLLSQYTNGDYYDWHTDIGGHCTWNYFCFREPKQFTGGDFVLSDSTYDNEVGSNTTTIECINDRLVIFPAHYHHCVTPVVTDTAFRYSVQLFFWK